MRTVTLRGADMEKLSSSTFTNMMHICRGNMCKLGLPESGINGYMYIIFIFDQSLLTLEIKLMILVLLLAPCSVENIN